MIVRKNLFKMIVSVSPLLVSVLLLVPAGGCGDSGRSERNATEIEKCDSLPSPVKQFVRAVTDNDSTVFAELVSYPLSRPYPLHDIETPEQMKAYYPVLVDDSLRTVVKNSVPDDWDEYGWRGWSLKRGDYVWIDEELYDVAYVSVRERLMLDSLRSEELGSVDRTLRDGWTPEFCLSGVDDSYVFRVDSRREEGRPPLYRIAIYEAGSDLRGKPKIALRGHREREGTAGTAIYYFGDKTGPKVVYVADVPDGSIPRMEISDSNGKTDTVLVKRAYWLDLLPEK